MFRQRILLLGSCLFLTASIYGQPGPCAFDLVQQNLIRQNPGYQHDVQHFLDEILPQLTQENNQRTLPAVINIPVVVHVIHSGQSLGVEENLSEERILSQIEILNQDYRRTNADATQTPFEFQSIAADTEIHFCLAREDPSGNFTNGITRHVYNNISSIDYIENTIKPETIWDPLRYLNIWTIAIPGSSIVGYSYLPSSTMVGSNKDGVVIHYSSFGMVSSANSGRTCTHEVGHYLGLQHTWGQTDNNGNPIGCTSDDGIADTPNCSGPSYGCPSFGISTCGDVDMIMNFMEYVNDDCMNLFTAGQKTVMQNTLNGIRSTLSENAISLCTDAVIPCKDITENPIVMGFESGESLLGWKTENANNDIRSWQITQLQNSAWGPQNGEGLALYLWNVNGITAADDYLFSPCFEMLEGHTYKVDFAYACAKDNNNVIFEEAFELGFSEQQSAEDYNVPNTDWVFENVNNPYPEYKTQSLYFTAETTTFTSIGFHVFSEADKYALQIDNFKLTDLGTNVQTTLKDPKVDCLISPNPTNGNLSVKVNFENNQKEVLVKIYDTFGRLIDFQIKQQVISDRFHFELSDHKDGLYFVNVESAQQLQHTSRIILIKSSN